MRRLISAVIAAALLALTPPGAAEATGLADPPLRFRQLATPHFIIYFHDGEERLALRLASIVEEIRTQLSSTLALSAPARTHVVLADQSELPNGWATPLPRNIVFLHAAAPSGAEFIGRTDDWMRLVFTHEYTHILHLDRSSGWAGALRSTFGRSPLVFPNLWLPEWQVEGLATWFESAEQGRRHAGDFRALVREDASHGRFAPVDQVNGGLVTWPGGHASYAYGLGFHEYLVNRFGERALGDLADTTSGYVPFAGTLAYRRVFGRPLGALWRDYAEAAIDAAGSVPAPPPGGAVQLTHHGQVVVAPRFAPARCGECGAEIVYTVRNPRTFPELRALSVDGAGDRALSTRYLGNTNASTGDAVLFDQQEIRRNVGSYSDLYVLDRHSGSVRAITREQRLQDPDLAHDGSAIVAVRQRRGERDLVLVRLDGVALSQLRIDDSRIETLASEPDAQFNTPRWSPDDRFIVAERRRLGALPELVLVDVRTRDLRVLAGDAGARIVTPAWAPDGRSVVAAADFDGGPFDLYEFPIEGGRARRLTRSSGAFWPDVSPDGGTIVFAGYTPSGFDVFRTSRRGVEGTRALRAPAPPPLATASLPSTLPGSVRAYSPLATLAPTSWTPIVMSSGGQTRLGGAVYGADLLARHVYTGELSWLLNAPNDAPTRPAAPDWDLAYAYTRWRPSFFVSTSRDTTFLRLGGEAATAEPAVVRDLEVQSGVSVPITHARTSQQFFASIVGRRAEWALSDGTTRTDVVAARTALAFNTARIYGYSISPQDGVRIGSTLELARQAFGSDASATMVTADARMYAPGFGGHHVLALRAAGARSNGSLLAGRLFTLGGAGASPSTIDFGGSALGLLRGFPANRFAGTHLDTLNADYRFPIARLERGAGAFPSFVRWAHGALFADAGRVYGGGRDGRWKSSFGVECSFDLVAGYNWPLVATVGVAATRDAGAPRGMSVFARVGRAF